MSRFSLTLAAAAVLLLGGCVLGPDYERPGVATPAEYRGASSAAADAATSGTVMASLPWWEVFDDEDLQGLIRTALANNQDLAVAAARVDEARALLGVTRADGLPQAGMSGAASRRRTPGTPSPLRTDAFMAALDLSYELDLWGRVRRNNEAGRATLIATEEDRQAVVSGLVTDVARSHFTLRELDRELEILAETTGTREDSLRLAEVRREHGIGTDLDVSRARAELASARAAHAETVGRIRQAENALAVLVGDAPRAIERPAAAEAATPIPSVPVGVPSELLERRPDVRAAEQRLAAATARIGAAKAAFFPRIALTASTGLESAELGDLLERHSGTWMIGGTVTQPIFEGGRHWFNLQASKARREQALAAYRATVLQALREVSDALAVRAQSDEQLRETRGQVDALAESARLTRRLHDLGQISQLETLDADRSLLAARLQFERVRLESQLASVRLYKALGGGVEQPAPDAAPGD